MIVATVVVDRKRHPFWAPPEEYEVTKLIDTASEVVVPGDFGRGMHLCTDC